jgi:hypothetical protein
MMEEASKADLAAAILRNLTQHRLVSKVAALIEEMDRAFTALSDVTPDEDAIMREYQTMIRGAVITKNAAERALKKISGDR